MPRGPDGASGSQESSRRLLSLALWAGLVTGFCEVAVFGVELLLPGYVDRSRDAVWMVPAFYAALFLIFGILLAGAARFVRVPWRAAAGFFAGAGAFLLLLLFPRLHSAASLVLAAGVGVSVARLANERVPAVRRLMSLTLPWLAGSVGVLALVTLGWRALAERRLVRSRPAAERGAPNVLLLILDTVRAADLSLYGYARRTTPELEQFAAGGVVFDRAFSPSSWTTPSHASMFTGHWAIDLDADWGRPLGKRWPTLAEILRVRGYATVAFVANEVFAGWGSGLARGFERFDDYPLSLWSAMEGTAFGDAVYPSVRQIAAPLLGRTPILWRMRLPRPSQHRSAERINDAFLSWLDQTRPATFFAFLNFMDAHMPFAPPDSFRNRFPLREAGSRSPEAWSAAPKRPLTPADVAPKQAAYNGSIAYLDSQLGRLFRELKRRGLLDNTLVIVASDHGEEFAEHGLVDHGNSLYRPSVQVPLVIWFPGHVPEGRRVAAAVSLRNLAATVLELVDTDRSALPGRSLARFWRGDDVTPDTIVTSVRQVQNQPAWYPASQGDLNSIAFDGWRYIRNEGTGSEELYDFETDLLEHRNVAVSPEGQARLPGYRGAIAALKPTVPGRRLARR